MRVYVSYNNFIGKFLNWQNEYNNMFDVARLTTIATSKGKVVLHVNYLFRSYIIKKYLQKCFGRGDYEMASERGRIARRATIHVHMYLCLSPSFNGVYN